MRRRVLEAPRLLAASVPLILAALPCAAAPARLDLDGVWSFRVDPQASGEAQGWAARDPGGFRPVTVPSSWNADPTGHYDGIAWYVRTLDLPKAMAGLHLELHFDGTFDRSTVWVNGTRAGTHQGGYTAYDIDVSRLLHAGDNRIAVELDNRPGFSTVPGFAMRQRNTGSVWYDWWRNGGIVRDVRLDMSQDGLIRSQRIDTDLTVPTAAVAVSVSVENVTRRPRTYHVATEIRAPDGNLVAQAETPLTLAGNAAGTAALSLTIMQPQLWNVGAAKLYRVASTLRDQAGMALDSRADTIGLRRIEIRNRRLFVNGQPVRLSGISRHEDSPWEGLAESRGTIAEDWNALDALHVTLTRPVHYPQPQAVLDQADRDGILLVPEIPVWQMSEAQLADPALRDAARRMMTEMIVQDGNHPSILAWSVCNESDVRLPGGTAYVHALKTLINRIDPGRFVTLADADVAISPFTDEAPLHDIDFIMANAYFGSWDGALDKIGPWLDFMDHTYRDKMVVVSEFGWPGGFSASAQAADKDRIDNFTRSMAAFEQRDFVAGAILWSYQDYRSPRNLPAGLTEGYVDHGLVDENRQRKPSYAAWERLNRPLSISAQWTGEGSPTGFSAQLVPNGPDRIPSYPMPGYRLHWRMTGPDHDVMGEAEQPLAGSLDKTLVVSGHWPKPSPTGGGTLLIEVLTPTGIVAADAHLSDSRLQMGLAPFMPAGVPGDPGAKP